MIRYEAVNVIAVDFSVSGMNEILQNLRTLFTTPRGTVPLDRDFGVDMSFLDMPLEMSKGRLSQQYIEKTREYEPRAEVLDVRFETSGDEGIVIPKVVIGLVS